MKQILTLLFLALAGAVSACNTIEGAGEDIQEGGEAIEDTARDANPSNPPPGR